MNGNRLKKSRKRNNLTAQQLADKIGVTRVTVARWENNVYEPDDETKKLLASILGVTVAYLMDEEYSHGPNIIDTDLSCGIALLLAYPLETVESFDAATNFRDVRTLEKGAEFVALPVEILKQYGDINKLFVVAAGDNSMEVAGLTEGTGAIVLLADSAGSAGHGDIALVRYNGRLIFRWLVKNSEGSIELRPANPAYHPEKLTKEEASRGDYFRVIGKVVGAVPIARPFELKKAF